MQLSNVVISEPKTGKILAIHSVGIYNILPNVNEIFETYDVANIEDIIHDAVLCDDFEFLIEVLKYANS